MTVTRGHPEMGSDQVRCPLTCDDRDGPCGFDSRHLHLFPRVTNYWDTDSAGRAAPLGLAPAEMVGALFYNFAPGEVARHIPKVWRAWNETATRANRHLGIAGGVGTASEHTVADDTVLDLISSQHHALKSAQIYDRFLEDAYRASTRTWNRLARSRDVLLRCGASARSCDVNPWRVKSDERAPQCVLPRLA